MHLINFNLLTTPQLSSYRTFIQNCHNPAILETNPKLHIDLTVHKVPTAPYLTYELLDGKIFSFHGKDITTAKMMEPLTYIVDQFYHDELFCEADQLLMKAIDDEQK
jgi:hypothetical protein